MVVIQVFLVLAAVYLYNQPFVETHEVYDIPADGTLAAELMAGDLSFAQVVPEGLFGVG